MLVRRQLARVARTPIARRTLATEATGKQATEKYFSDLNHLEHHAHTTGDLWRKISNYFFIPAIAVCGIWVYQLEKEHAAHQEHMIHDNGGTYPFPPAYEYMNFRVKPFPWGKNNLFFNPVVNPDLEKEE
ncbi:COX6A, subunit VIa of cytochrome c oxidase [Flagelloscypha sp. PMI_526]|nr:COX6A, subunit VIa of cytochrome c oxidase [Flagelloscypha sp. PMI_526]